MKLHCTLKNEINEERRGRENRNIFARRGMRLPSVSSIGANCSFTLEFIIPNTTALYEPVVANDFGCANDQSTLRKKNAIFRLAWKWESTLAPADAAISMRLSPDLWRPLNA